ncbi:hypothetical protein C5167_007711 [Papaver somniferum]|nr:hypothetical protein C5167_007711 [Papaver somniferum]
MARCNTMKLALKSNTVAILILLNCLIPLLFSQVANGHGSSHSDDEEHVDDVGGQSDVRKGLVLVKVYCLIIFLVSTFVGGVSPYYLSDRDAKIEVEDGRSMEELERNTIAPSTHLQPTEVLLKNSSFSDTMLLIAALCFHSIFEGIAVGVPDNKADAWRSLWTILLHKIFAAIAMGIALLRLLPDREFLTTISYSFAFAVSSPIGVGIGIGIGATADRKVADWIYAITTGFATGIFIYVAIHHLISKGFKPQKPSYFNTPFFKFASVLLGVGVMAVAMIWD